MLSENQKKVIEFAEKEIANGTPIANLAKAIFKDAKVINCTDFSDQQRWDMLDYVSAKMDDLYEKHPNAFKDLRPVDNDTWSYLVGFGEDKYAYYFYTAMENVLTF